MNRLVVYLGLLAVLLGLVVVIVIRQTKNSDSTQPTPIDFAVTAQSLVSNHAYQAALINQFLLFYDSQIERIVRVNLGLSNTETFTADISPDSYIIWGPSGDQALTFQSGSGWSHLDFITSKITALHQRIFAPTWNKDGTKIAYLFVPIDLARSTITVARPDGSQWQSVFNLAKPGKLYRNLWWGPKETLLVAIDDDIFRPAYEKILLSSQKTESIIEGSGKLRWSPQGDLALIGLSDKKVGILDIESNQVQALTPAVAINRIVWQDTENLIWADSTNKIYRYLIASQESALIGQTDGQEINQLIGVYNNEIIFTQGLKLSKLKLKALSS